MTIYDILLNLETTQTTRRRKYFLKKDFYDTYEYILAHDDLDEKSSFPQILFCVTNNIKTSPLCSTCSKKVTWNKQSNIFHTFCSSKCSIHVAISAATSDESKTNRKETVMALYGVENVNNIPTVRYTIHQKQLSFWAKKHPTSDYKELYNRYVWKVEYNTHKTYVQYQNYLDPDGIRGKDYHIDHLYSKYDGYHNNVPVEVLCHWSNLRLIDGKENMSKSRRSDKTLSELYEDYYSALSEDNGTDS